MARISTAVAIVVTTAALGAGGAVAQTAEEFYKGQQVKLIVSSGAGGGYDVYSRMLARHIVRHLPAVRIVVQNMPGASGLAAINHVYNAAERDGTVFSDTYSTMPLYPLLDGANAKFDVQKLNWLGSISRALSVCISWHTGEFKTLDDAVARPMRLSSTGATGWRSILPRFYNEVGGTRFQVILGYNSSGAYLAIERGEVDGSCTTYDTLSATQVDWIQNRKITFLAQFGLQPHPDLPGVPMGLDRIKKPEDRAAAELILSQQEMGRPYMMPPGVPQDRVALFREAFTRTMNDKLFRDESKQANLMVDPLTGAEMDSIIRKAYALSSETVGHARAILKRAGAK